MWTVYGAILETAELGGGKTVSLRFRPNSNKVMKLFSTWFIFHDTTFTALSLRLYDDRNGSAGKLIATSTNSYAPGDIFTDDYSIYGLGFEFDDIALMATSWYHLVPYATGYTGSDLSHVAWVKGWPDNEYREGLDLSFEEIHVSPYRLGPIGADF